MPVAKTYASFKISGEPFKEDGRMYVNVQAPKGIKKVRWYNDAEYARMYPEEEKKDVMDFNARHAFGFDDLGFITIYKTANENVLSDFVESHHEAFRRNLTFGYYTPSRIPVPELPDGVEAIKLTWEEVQDKENRMKPHEDVIKYIGKVFNQALNVVSVFQGEIDTWIERDLVVSNNKTVENHFGEKHIHSMIDANGNLYQWETGTKNYEVGKAMRLKMKVKEHKDIGGFPTTIVWYCKEV